MNTASLRKELHSMIDTLPDGGLKAIRPLILYISDDYWKPVTEAASPEECAMIDERVKEYKENPESFTDWEDVKKELGL